MTTQTINGVEYEIGELPPLKALQVGRRLAPVLAHAVPALMNVAGADNEKKVEIDLLLFSAAAVPIADALSKMTDEDFEYVAHECMAVCQRKQSRGWARVVVNGSLMFQDIKPSVILALVKAVVEASLGDFFAIDQPQSPEPSK